MEEKEIKPKKIFILYLVIFLIIGIIFLFLVIIKQKQNTNIKENKISEVKEESYNNNEINSLKDKGDYKGIIDTIEKKHKNLSDSDKYFLALSYLKYGEDGEKKQENIGKAVKILDELKPSWATYFYKGYAKEINKNYSGALINYEKSYSFEGITDNEKSLILNKIGYLHELKGEYDKTFQYYLSAYNLDNKNTQVMKNLGKYYLREEKYEKAKYFIEKSFELSQDIKQKGELYYLLSELEYGTDGLNLDIDKIILYAKKGIELYEKYPMNYLALAKGYYMKNDNKYDNKIIENLKKAENLNPNLYNIYNIYTLHFFDKKDTKKTIEYFEQTLKTINKELTGNYKLNKKREILIENDVLNKLQNYKTENKKNEAINYLKKMIKVSKTKKIIKKQLQRKGYGNLSFLSDLEEFNDLTK